MGNKKDYEIESVSMFRDNGSEGPGEKAEFFKPADRVLHFLVKLKSVSFGNLSFKWIFTAVNTMAGNDILVAEVESSGLIANQVTGMLSLDKDWPIGFYRADLFIKDEHVTSINYLVTPALDELKSEAISFFRSNGSKDEEVQNFETADKILRFQVVLDGLILPGIKTRWVLSSVESQDSLVKITEVSEEFESAVNKLSVSFSAERDWPAGSYKVDLYLDDNLFEEIPFNIS